jgi:hypothetical protein
MENHLPAIEHLLTQLNTTSAVFSFVGTCSRCRDVACISFTNVDEVTAKPGNGVTYDVGLYSKDQLVLVIDVYPRECTTSVAKGTVRRIALRSEEMLQETRTYTASYILCITCYNRTIPNIIRTPRKCCPDCGINISIHQVYCLCCSSRRKYPNLLVLAEALRCYCDGKWRSSEFAITSQWADLTKIGVCLRCESPCTRIGKGRPFCEDCFIVTQKENEEL